nr:MAG TPA: hypothetical protein [Caudoviricetes sp.]
MRTLEVSGVFQCRKGWAGRQAYLGSRQGEHSMLGTATIFKETISRCLQH